MKERLMFYKAVKHQAVNYYADHGYSVLDMWKTIKSGTELGEFWREECCKDYLSKGGPF